MNISASSKRKDIEKIIQNVRLKLTETILFLFRLNLGSSFEVTGITSKTIQRDFFMTCPSFFDHATKTSL